MGFNLGISVRSQAELNHRSFGFGPPSDRDRDGMLQVGVRFADGRESSASGHGPSPAVIAYYEAWQEGREPDVPAGPIVAQGGGSAGGKRMDSHYWVWPLPPDGPLTISCEWRAGGVSLTSTEVDGGAIRSAGKTSTSLWQ